MLDHDDRVADVPQAQQGIDQFAVVTLVQPDGRLVQHVQDTDQPAPDLGGQPDALGLSAGQGAGIAVQRKIIEPDVHQELQARPHLSQHPVGDQVVPLGKRKVFDGFRRITDRQVAQLEYAPAPDGDSQALRLEPRPAALAAGHFPHIALDLLPHIVGLSLGVPALQVMDDAFVGRVVRTRPSIAVLVMQMDLRVARPVKDGLLVLLFELPPRDRGGNPEGLGHALEQPPEVLVARPGPGRDRAVVDRQVGVGHHKLGVDLITCPQAVATAGTLHKEN